MELGTQSRLWLWKLHLDSTGSPCVPVVLVGRVFRVLSIWQRKSILIPLQGWSKSIYNSHLGYYPNFLIWDWCSNQIFQTGPHLEHLLRRQRLGTRLGWGMLSNHFCFGAVPLHTEFPPLFRAGRDLWVHALPKHFAEYYSKVFFGEGDRKCSEHSPHSIIILF